MVDTDKKVDGLSISYKIEENGYSIYLGGQLWITQYDQYSKPMDNTKSIEENCLLQIEDITKPYETDTEGA
jgi:hypothetical protein